MEIEEKPEYKLEMEISIGGKIVSLNYKKFLLLKYIDEYGSIMKASQKSSIPYRTALKNIEIMEEKLGSSIISTHRGGKGGGGASSVTDIGKQILWEYTKLTSILKKHSEVNEIKGKITGIYEKNRVMNVDIEGKNVIIPLDHDFKKEDKVLVLISPDDIFVTLEPHESSVRNVFEGKIVGMELNNEMVRLTVKLNSTKIYVDVTEYSREKLDLELGMDIFIGFKAASATLIKI
jgi:molybdate transport system regulatory protein